MEYGDKRTEKGEQAKQAIKMTLASILTNFTVQRLGWIGGSLGGVWGEFGGEDYRAVVTTLYEESRELFMFYKRTETPFNPSQKLFICIYL